MCSAYYYERECDSNDIIESSKVLTKNVCNYINYKYQSLVPEQWQDHSCDNFFHHLCQNKYDMETYVGGFDSLHHLKKRCKSCVDKLMTVFDNSLKNILLK